jgi:hypothetical protein
VPALTSHSNPELLERFLTGPTSPYAGDIGPRRQNFDLAAAITP